MGKNGVEFSNARIEENEAGLEFTSMNLKVRLSFNEVTPGWVEFFLFEKTFT